MSFISTVTISKVRKKRRCYWCGEHVESTAIVVTESDSGTMFSTTFHPECHEAMLAFCKDPANLGPDDVIEEHAHKRGTDLEKGESRCES